MTTYWLKQTPDKPLFPNMLWSKPENKLHAGKLLVIGGNLHGFSAPATAFAEARKAGIGSQRVVLPDAIQKTVGAYSRRLILRPVPQAAVLRSRHSVHGWNIPHGRTAFCYQVIWGETVRPP
jgi:NAD(P)H-hydrate repair Nnr-like enzyme with NAD(P)H-hydrate dehydratase domain